MRLYAIILQAALLARQCLAQFNGLRVLSVNVTASGLDINNLGGSALVSYAYSKFKRICNWLDRE